MKAGTSNEAVKRRNIQRTENFRQYASSSRFPWILTGAWDVGSMSKITKREATHTIQILNYSVKEKVTLKQQR